MFVDTCKSGKYVRHLLRESFREGGKVRHRTIANISHCSEAEIKALKWALKHKHQLEEARAGLEKAGSAKPGKIDCEQGASVGALRVLHAVARRLGVTGALGSSRQGKLALWQVLARIIDQGSRLSAVRLASGHAACEVLGIDQSFNEDHLYENLDWLCENQRRIEDRLFKKLHGDKPPGLYLYDVTSSYLEGTCNELSAFGYNRDKKKGKRQIVVGLLCDGRGRPLSIEVFAGNTQDPATVAAQIRKISKRFGGGQVSFVGDRGMIKSRQISDLLDNGLHYVTAITKPQIRRLLKTGVFQPELFDRELSEILDEEDGKPVRYVLRRNPVRAGEIREQRRSKLATLEALLEERNAYLAGHPRAVPRVALAKLQAKREKLGIGKWVETGLEGRSLVLRIDREALGEESELDGCYVIKTDLSRGQADAQTVHDRYKDLAQVEWAFRTSKTVLLEMRPINVRLESRTRGHALVVMLAYRIVQELADCWRSRDTTVQEAIDGLSSLCATTLRLDGEVHCQTVPKPRRDLAELIELAGVRMPEAIPARKVHVSTRKKLTSRRKKH
jgi:hypothetical protein